MIMNLMIWAACMVLSSRHNQYLYLFKCGHKSCVPDGTSVITCSSLNSFVHWQQPQRRLAAKVWHAPPLDPVSCSRITIFHRVEQRGPSRSRCRTKRTLMYSGRECSSLCYTLASSQSLYSWTTFPKGEGLCAFVCVSDSTMSRNDRPETLRSFP